MSTQLQLDEIRSALARIKSEQSSLAGLSDTQADLARTIQNQSRSDLGIAVELTALAAASVLAYHGYKRNNDSIGWGIGWWFLGGAFPVGTAIGAFLAYDKGFAKPIKQEAK